VLELRYLWLCMDLCVHLPLIVTLLITLELDQVLQAVVTHSAVQYCLNLILLLAIDKSCGWGWCRSSARDGIRRRRGQLDHGEDGVKVAEVVRESKVVCAMANTSLDDGLLVAMSLPSNQTLSPCANTMAGSHQWL
jgi:hypothetical protein